MGSMCEEPEDTALFGLTAPVLPSVGRIFDIEQAKAQTTCFRLEWREENNSERHFADYATMVEAQDAQNRLRRMGRILANITPLENP